MFRKHTSHPSDAETAKSMLGLAEAFRSGTAEETGIHLGWDEADAERLDDLADEFVSWDPSEDVRHSMVLAMGAYLGELIVRNGGGRWRYDEAQQAAAVEVRGEQPRWYEVTTEEAWPYLVAKHEPRYGKGAGLVMEIPPT